MALLHQLQDQLLTDKRITAAEVAVIQDFIRSDGQLDLADVKFLVGLRAEALAVCNEFERLFFSALKKVILQDGQIGHDERFYLLKLIYADGKVSAEELRFLDELREEADETNEEFEQFYASVLAEARMNAVS